MRRGFVLKKTIVFDTHHARHYDFVAVVTAVVMAIAEPRIRDTYSVVGAFVRIIWKARLRLKHY